MKQYITWICDRCNAIFEFDAEVAPLRCPDCLSAKEHLHQMGENRITDTCQKVEEKDRDLVEK